jgi:hypothetical protein
LRTFAQFRFVEFRRFEVAGPLETGAARFHCALTHPSSYCRSDRPRPIAALRAKTRSNSPHPAHRATCVSARAFALV